MSAVRRTLGNINTQVGSLPATAKLLIGALMVILVLSLLVVAQFAGRPSMVPLPIDMTPEARAAALSHLERAGIPYQERDGRLYVAAEQKYTVLGQLTNQEVISGEQINFDTLIREESPFLTQAQNRRRWQVAKMNVLSTIISGFDGIERAKVVVDLPERGSFASAYVPPTASVTVVPRGEGLSQGQVEAIANLVAGSQPGLKASEVQVIDARHGTSHQARSSGTIASGNYLELKQAAELHVREKIEHSLAYILGVRVAVNAMVDARQVERRTDSYKEAVVGPLSSSTRNIDSTTQSQDGEPGVRPNTGATIARSATGGSRLTDERSEETTKPVFPVEADHISDPKGYALEINATIGVPRSYFVGLYRLEKNDPQALPDDKALDPVATPEIARIKAGVEPLVDSGPFEEAVPGTVVVSMIPDLAVAAAPLRLPPEESAAPAGVPLPAGLLKYLGLASLVLLSLLMMFLMVRKAGGPRELPSAQEVAGIPPSLSGDYSEVVGEADESAPALEGIELDDSELRRQQMLSQIGDMVKNSPDDAANLLRRWIGVTR